MNARMADLKTCFEEMGFEDVRTVLSSGNVVFTTAAKAEARLAKSIESGMAEYLPRSFPVIVRKVDYLLAMLKTDPYSGFRISPGAKRVVTFLSEPFNSKVSLPAELDGARILSVNGTEAFSVYVPNERGPVFMILIEKTFGKNVTTRTLDTVKKCTAA
jgi:uncharacterized protein (DUF1697 family)